MTGALPCQVIRSCRGSCSRGVGSRACPRPDAAPPRDQLRDNERGALDALMVDRLVEAMALAGRRSVCEARDAVIAAVEPAIRYGRQDALLWVDSCHHPVRRPDRVLEFGPRLENVVVRLKSVPNDLRRRQSGS